MGELSDSARTLVQTLFAHQNQLITKNNNVWRQFANDMRVVHTDTVTGIRTSFLGNAMEASYQACAHESGSGSHARRKAIINRGFRDQHLFSDIIVKAQDEFTDKANQYHQGIQTAVTDHLAAIRATLDLMRDENVATESERDPEFRARLGTEVRSGRDEWRRIHEVISPP
jgi:hypothetical protein